MVVTAAKAPGLPLGYTKFEDHILSDEGFSEGRRLYSEVQIRHPDMQEEFVYIYNDFAGYGQCEVIENCLIDIAKDLNAGQSDQNLLKAWHKLEGLSVFVMEFFKEWTGVDDGAYTEVLTEIYASAVLTLCRLLKAKGLLSTAKIHNFKEVLSNIADTVEEMNTMADEFTKSVPIIKAFAKGENPTFDTEKYDFISEATTLVGGEKYIVKDYLASGGFRITMDDIEEDRKEKMKD